VVLFVFTAAVGLFLAPELPIDLHPAKREPVLTVTFELPDASPSQVEQEATAPLENVLSQISQIRQIYSTSSYRHGTIEIMFDRSVDFEIKKFEVSTAIRHVYPKLNPRVSYPLTDQRKQKDEAERVLLLYRIYAPFQTYQIKETVETVFLAALSQTADVSRVDVTGASGLQAVVEYDPWRLSRFNLTGARLADLIVRESQTQVVGHANSRAGQQTLMRLRGAPAAVHELENLSVQVASTSVPLRSLARIYLEEAPPAQLLRINGQNAVALAVYADQKVNRLALASTVSSRVDRLKTQLPPAYELVLEQDDTEFLRTELKKTYSRSALSIFVLIVFILLVYRSVRKIILLLSGILITFCLTALGSYLLGLGIHLYSIAGLTIAFGILLDNLILMLDALTHGRGKQVWRAIVGATFCSVLCLGVVFFLPPAEQENLAEFGITLMLAVVVSVLVAIWFIPAAFRLAGPPHNQPLPKTKRRSARLRHFYLKAIAVLAERRKILLLACVLLFGTPVFLLPTSWDGHPWYNATLGSDWYQEKMRPISDPLLGGTLRAFVRNVFERSGFRSPEKTRLFVQAGLAHGHTLADMDRVIAGMEKYLLQFTAIDRFVSHIYSGQSAQIIITFKEKQADGAFPYQLKARLIAQSLDWAGVEWNIFGVGRGFSNSSTESLPNFKVQLKGYNYQELERQAVLLADRLLTHKRIQKVNTNERLSWFEKNTDEWVLRFREPHTHRLRARESLLTLSETAGFARQIEALRADGIKIPLIIRGKNADKFSTHELTAHYIRPDTGTTTLRHHIDVQKQTTLNAIHKENRQYIRQVGFDYFGSYQFGNQFLTETLAEMKPALPPGYTAEKESWLFDWQRIKRNYALLALVLVLVYLASAALFENLTTPLLISGSVPFSFIGIFLVFGAGEFYFDQGGYAAFILLAALAVAGSIYMVAAIRQQTKKATARAVAKAVFTKLNPISLSMISTCLGLVPFIVLGDHEIFWFALATGTLGGMAAAAVYVFVIIPALMTRRGKEK